MKLFTGEYDNEFDLRANHDSGQMWLDDRKLLWSTVREHRPVIAAETGTWRGGGSTYFILNAMMRNGVGMLYSVEANAEMYLAAKRDYDSKWAYLKPHLSLNFGDSVETYRMILQSVELDFLLLDGGEEVTAAEYDLLAPKVRVGGVLMTHDWYNGKFVQALYDDYQRGIWDLHVIGTGDGNFEHGSVGMTKAVRLR